MFSCFNSLIPDFIYSFTCNWCCFVQSLPSIYLCFYSTCVNESDKVNQMGLVLVYTLYVHQYLITHGNVNNH